MKTQSDHGGSRGDHKLIDIERPPITETAILVRLALPDDGDDELHESIEEMERLAWTAGANVVNRFVQRRPKPCPATLIGKGKIEEIRVLCEEQEADLVIVDSDLTPTQGSKLQDLLNVKVVDRTQLILDIFAQRARTNEGKHQVELAQLQYLLPRLAGRGAVMRQQGGIGVRGPGEQKLEVDRRVIRIRIERLRDELEEIRKHRRVQRKSRGEGAVGAVALVGYTNAGKSSLLNAITGAGAFVEDKLFATLDPTSRRCTLPSRRTAVFTDTVGFIRKLPHSLVAAFRATLEEVAEADLILLVADASHPAVEEHIRVVHEVLDEIEVGDTPIMTVFNKADIADPERVGQLTIARPRSVAISALSGEGINTMLHAVEEVLNAECRRVRLRIPQSQAGVVALIHRSGRVLTQTYENEDILVEAELGPALYRRLAEFHTQGSSDESC